MDKSKRTNQEQQQQQQSTTFSDPEMEAALQLIQLSGDSEADPQSHELIDSATCDLLSRKKRKEVGDDGESQGSNSSSISSTSDLKSVKQFVNSWCADEEEGEDGLAGSRRRRRKFRSVVEIYEMSNYY